jgi:hypothetical protein
MAVIGRSPIWAHAAPPTGPATVTAAAHSVLATRDQIDDDATEALKRLAAVERDGGLLDDRIGMGDD